MKSVLLAVALSFFSTSGFAQRLTMDRRPLLQAAHFYQVQKIRQRMGTDLATLYDRMYYKNQFHPDLKVINDAFSLFKFSQSVNWDVVDHLESQTPEIIQQAIEKLKHEPSARLAKLLSDGELFRQWLEKEFPDNGSTHEDYIEVDGHYIEKEFYKSTVKLIRDLQAKGIETRFVPAPTLNGTRVGRGVLIIEKVRTAAKSSAYADEPILESQLFLDFLRRAKDQLGSIVIDPELLDEKLTQAYFWENTDLMKNIKWIIAIQPNTRWDTFVHEWTHKIDLIDNENQELDAVSERLDNARQSTLGQSLFAAGSFIEQENISEMNATAAELGLMIEQGRFSLHPTRGLPMTWYYRATILRRVAIGRIFMEPTNPGHYLLYLKSRVMFYAPIVLSPVLLPTLVATAAIDFLKRRFLLESPNALELAREKTFKSLLESGQPTGLLCESVFN